MGCDTKGLLVYKKEEVNVFEVLGNIQDAINKLVLESNKDIPRWKIDKDQYSFVKTEFSSFCGSGLFTSYFRYKGEGRILHCTVGCESDLNPNVHPELEGVEGSTIWLSLGMWGESDLYIKTVLEACKPFGRVFFTHNDCSEEFKEL